MPTRSAPMAVTGGLGDFHGETDAVLHAATPLVGALIGGGVEELLDHVAVRTVQFDSVEPGFYRAFGRIRIFLQWSGRCQLRSSPLEPDGVACHCCPSTSRPVRQGRKVQESWRLIATVGGMTDATGVHQLNEYFAAPLAWTAIGHLFPSLSPAPSLNMPGMRA